MRKLSYLLIIMGTIAAMPLLNSCGDNKAGDNTEGNSSSTVNHNELKGFMLGGIYFVNGYGGKAAFENMIHASGNDKENIIAAAEKYLIFPFQTDDSTGSRQMLESMWDIKNKEDLLKTLDELKNHKMQSSYTKSWDYARYVNNVCMGYAATYLTKEEGQKLTAAILPLAQADYKTWDDYFADFAAGRAKWSSGEGGDSDQSTYEALSNSITKGINNIYTILPLN